MRTLPIFFSLATVLMIASPVHALSICQSHPTPGAILIASSDAAADEIEASGLIPGQGEIPAPILDRVDAEENATRTLRAFGQANGDNVDALTCTTPDCASGTSPGDMLISASDAAADAMVASGLIPGQGEIPAPILERVDLEENASRLVRDLAYANGRNIDDLTCGPSG